MKGTITIDILSLISSQKAALAPMAGVADRAMREMCMAYGAAFCVSELVSAKAVTLGDKKSASLLQIADGERPMGLQLFGGEPEVMAKAAEVALRNRPDFIDINMGCPAPKVISSGGGSSLMKDVPLTGQVVAAICRAVAGAGVPVTVKMRAGYDQSHKNAVDVARACEQAGAAMITVHGRTREQMYAPPVDYGIIRDVKQAVKIPVIGNGDVTSGASAVKMILETGCDMVMVGRGATGAPWVFNQINACLKSGINVPDPTLAEKMEIMLRHIRLMADYRGEKMAMLHARRHAAWYMRGLPGAAALRRRCGGLSALGELEEMAENIINNK